MAATVQNLENLGFGGPGGKWLYAEVKLDSAYAAGGESVTAALFGLYVIKAIFTGSSKDGELIDVRRSTDSTWLFKIWTSAAQTTSASVGGERAVGQDLSSVTIPVLIRGL
jgi:hypothetical protein